MLVTPVILLIVSLMGFFFLSNLCLCWLFVFFVPCYLGGSTTESRMLSETRRTQYVAGGSYQFFGRSEIKHGIS